MILNDYKIKIDLNSPDYLIPTEELKEFLLKNKSMLFDKFNTDIDTFENRNEYELIRKKKKICYRSSFLLTTFFSINSFNFSGVIFNFSDSDSILLATPSMSSFLDKK